MRWGRFIWAAVMLALLLAAPGAVARGHARGGKGHRCRSGQWCSARSGRYPFEVWIKSGSDPAGDRAALTSTVGLLDSLWGPETRLMGSPLPDIAAGATHGHGKAAVHEPADDSGNDSTRFDVYIVGPTDPVHRGDRDYRIGAGNVAVTNPAPTSAVAHPPRAASGFLLLGADRLAGSGFRSDVAHEFFHALQYAHNAETKFTCLNRRFWFTEASASWAETYFVPKTAATEVYWRVTRFQTGSTQDASSWGLEDTSDPGHAHQYDSFMWPYFMQQERGAKAIAAAYKAMEGASTCDELQQAVDAQLPFAAHMREFALRNLDDSTTFDKGSLAPITPRYQALHADFPDSNGPPATDVELSPHVSSDPPTSEPVTIPPLRAWYYALHPDSDVAQVVIDGGGLSGAGFDLDAVKDVNGTWQVQHLSPGRTSICVYPDSVSPIFLVVTNHSQGAHEILRGDVNISSLLTRCGCPDFTKATAFNGTASMSFSGSASHSDGSTSESISLSHSASGIQLTLPLNPSDVQHAAFTGSGSGGTVTVNDADDYNDGSGTSHTTATGSGSTDPNNSAASVTFTPAGCTYHVSVTASIPTTYSGKGPPPADSGIVDTVTSPELPIPEGLNLSGSASVLGYQTGPTDLTGIANGFYTLFYAPDESWGTELTSVKGVPGNQPIGNATFSWNLSPTLSTAADRARTARRSSRRR